jgi:4-hydroxyphenylacetate 3-monooxygenase
MRLRRTAPNLGQSLTVGRSGRRPLRLGSYLDQYLRGSNGYKAEERVKLLKLLWDCIGSEFGGRHELYEINYGGSTEEIRRYCLFGAQASGNADRFKGFAEECMAEYGIDGWRVPDLSDPGEFSYHLLRKAR